MSEQNPIVFPWVQKAKERADRIEFMKSFMANKGTEIKKVDSVVGMKKTEVRIWTEEELHRFYGIIF